MTDQMEQLSNHRKNSLQRCYRGVVDLAFWNWPYSFSSRDGSFCVAKAGLRSWAHAVLLPQPPKQLGRQHVLQPGRSRDIKQGLSEHLHPFWGTSLEDVIWWQAWVVWLQSSMCISQTTYLLERQFCIHYYTENSKIIIVRKQIPRENI